MNIKASFFGGAGSVTGSKFLLEARGKRILVDCGLFQGLKELRLRNWAPFPTDASRIDAVIITHAHIDHSGYLPRLVKEGFKGRIYASRATFELAKIMLPDSAKIMEEEAEYANVHGYSKHSPALALFTSADASRALSMFYPVEFEAQQLLEDHLSFSLHPVGHILGASLCVIHERKKSLKFGFSGDVGRPSDPIMRKPSLMPQVHYLFLESTYGDRLHADQDPIIELSKLVKKIRENRSVLLIPAFAVGRTQEILYFLNKLRCQSLLKDIPVYVDSPMATAVTDLYWRFNQLHKLSKDDCSDINTSVTFVRNAEQSIGLYKKPSPKIIISASGMATGGRVLHHLKNYLPKQENVVLFAGFQAEATRGRKLLEGAKSVKIHGQQIPSNAQLSNLTSLSAHADQAELLSWLEDSKLNPRKVFLVHGEQASLEALKDVLEKRFLWDIEIAHFGQCVELN